MGGTAPICPFCKKECASGGVKDHVHVKHPDRYREWIDQGRPPYWRYDNHGQLRELH